MHKTRGCDEQEEWPGWPAELAPTSRHGFSLFISPARHREEGKERKTARIPHLGKPDHLVQDGVFRTPLPQQEEGRCVPEAA